MLKLYAELVNNRSQRLQFDISSPNGILLFRDASKLLVNYGSKNLMIGDIANDQIYPLKLKGISICFSIMKLALSGNYVNFGVFQLYGDRALEDALNTIIKLILSMSIANILVRQPTPFQCTLTKGCLCRNTLNLVSRTTFYSSALPRTI